MLRHQVHHILICERTSAGTPLPAAVPVSTCARSAGAGAACALPADDPAAGTAVPSRLVESPRNPPRSGSGRFAVHPRSRGCKPRTPPPRQTALPVLASPTQRRAMTSEDLYNSSGRAFSFLVACPVAVAAHIQVLRRTLLGQRTSSPDQEIFS